MLRLDGVSRLAVRWYSAQPNKLDAELRTALKSAMKARDSFKSTLFKSVLAELQNASHTSSPPPPNKTLLKCISLREEGAKLYQSSNPPRPDLVEQYNQEVSILQQFVEPEPEGLSDAELDNLVDKVLGSWGKAKQDLQPQDKGKLIKELITASEGKAPGKQVSQFVSKLF